MMSASARIKQVHLLIGGRSPTVFRYVGVGPQEQQKPDRIYLIIPGNPGVAQYYDDFMLELRDRLARTHGGEGESAATIWSVSHVGHQPVDARSLDVKDERLEDRDSPYTLPEQIEHKISLISELVPRRSRLTLIGHSVGCLMALEAAAHFAREGQRPPVATFMLMPMLQRMAQTPNGPFAQKQTTYLYHLTITFVWILGLLLSKAFKQRLIRWQMNWGRGDDDPVPDCCVQATTNLLHWSAVRAALFMAHSELQLVKELDHAKLGLVAKHTRIYFGENDGWCPREFAEEMLRRTPVEAEWSSAPHAFVLHRECNASVAEACAKWLEEEEPRQQ